MNNTYKEKTHKIMNYLMKTYSIFAKKIIICLSSVISHNNATVLHSTLKTDLNKFKITKELCQKTYGAVGASKPERQEVAAKIDIKLPPKVTKQG